MRIKHRARQRSSECASGSVPSQPFSLTSSHAALGHRLHQVRWRPTPPAQLCTDPNPHHRGLRNLTWSNTKARWRVYSPHTRRYQAQADGVSALSSQPPWIACWPSTRGDLFASANPTGTGRVRSRRALAHEDSFASVRARGLERLKRQKVGMTEDS